MRQAAVAVCIWLGLAGSAAASGPLTATKVGADLSQVDPDAAYWKAAPPQTVALMAQPMVPPRPLITTTTSMEVQAVHDGRHLAFRLRWKAAEPKEGGRLGEFSDAVAVQFPAVEGEAPPPVFMGAPGSPVYILHWRAQYQRDAQKGRPTIKDLYPNLSVDFYPMEFSDNGNLPEPTDEQRRMFLPSRATGNPQTGGKSGVDEILAEGFSSSAVTGGGAAFGEARWADGEWTAVLVRPLQREGLPTLTPGATTFAAFAAWQGASDEVGSRKSVTMSWLPVLLSDGRTASRER